MSKSSPIWFQDVGGTLYIRTKDGVHGSEPWMSDGTKAGTVLVADLYPGVKGSHPSWISDLDGTAYVSARRPATGRELWRGSR